jgi:hypothetical protein
MGKASNQSSYEYNSVFRQNAATLCIFNAIFISSKDLLKTVEKSHKNPSSGRMDGRTEWKNRHYEASRRFPQLCVDKSNVLHRLELAWLRKEEPTDFKFALVD